MRQPATALIAAMTHSGQVLAQRQAYGKGNEIPAFAALLDGVDLTGAVITADALHTQHDHAAYLHRRGAHNLAVVKRNHPGLCRKARGLPWSDICLDHYERGRAHHCDEIRRLTTAAFAHIDCPHVCQALQVVCWRRDLANGKLTIEPIYLVVSLPPGAATGSELATWMRGHRTSKISSTTSGTAPSVGTPSKAVPATCPASWLACATSPSTCTARTATPTSPPPSATPVATTSGPSPPSE
ncbi:transposase [Streptomyces sp. NPDC048002]|uniref:transposase n=1 Tax=Streptomyces sp. NPDC048002 TaxID=3154344 RepID=UPI0033CCA5BD